MKFLRLEVEDFLSYKHLVLDLTDIAYTSVTGLNGSGKSTIPLAIAWAIYGTLRVGGDRESIIRDEADDVRVILDLEDNDGNFWRIERQNSYSSTATVRLYQWSSERNDFVSFGDHLNRTAQAQIDQIVGLSEAAFYSLVIMDQSSTPGMTYFTGADSNTRRAILHGLVPELELWSRYHERSSEELTEANRTKRDLEVKVKAASDQIDILRDRREVLLDDIGDETAESIEADRKKIAKKVETLTTRIAQRAEDAGVSRIEARIEAARAKHSAALSELNADLDRLRSELKGREDLEARADDLDDDIAKAEAALKSLKRQKKDSKERIRGLIEEADRLREAVERQEPKVEALETKVSNLLARRDSITKQLEGLGIAIEQDDGRCPVCSSPLSKEKCQDLAHELKQELREVEDGLEESRDALKNLKTKLGDNRRLLGTTESDIAKARSDRESLAGRIEDREDDISRLEERLDGIEENLDGMRSKKDIKKDIQAKRDEVESLEDDFRNNTYAELQRELEQAQSGTADEHLQEELEELRDKEARLAERFRRFADRSGALSEIEASIKSAEEKHEALLADQKANAKDIEQLTWIDRAVSPKGIPSMLLDSVLASIEDEQNAILEQLGAQMQVEFRQSRDQKNGGKKDVLDIIVHTANGKERQIESFSLGEKVRLSISNLFAMIKVFNARNGGVVRTLFLDEPLGPLDRENVPAFVEVLRVAMNQGIVDSIWVITHDQTVIDALPQELKVTRSVENGSEVTLT